MDRNHNLVIEAAQYCAKEWKTKLFCPPEYYGSMVTVELPNMLGYELSGKSAAGIRANLVQQYSITIPILFVNNKLIVRLSAQLYNEMSDYIALANAIKEMSHASAKL